MVPLGVDKEKLLFQLERLQENILRLKKLRDKKGDEIYSAKERLFQICIEECLNIRKHIICGLNLKRADTYKEVFIRLREVKIISKDLEKKMLDFTTMRNRLVHLYWKVTKKELDEELKDIDHLKEFAKRILKVSERQKQSLGFL